MSDEPAEPPRTGSNFINRIVALSLEQRILVGFLTLLLIAAGIRAWGRLPVDAYPDLSPPMVSITAQWPGHSAEEVERLITVPIEREMNGIPKENNLRSVSLYALSSVDLTFDQDTDRNFARQQVFNRLAALGIEAAAAVSIVRC
jgi:cobalt-zinc-cadmium resistance protein CzcA